VFFYTSNSQRVTEKEREREGEVVLAKENKTEERQLSSITNIPIRILFLCFTIDFTDCTYYVFTVTLLNTIPLYILYQYLFSVDIYNFFLFYIYKYFSTTPT